MAHRHPRPGDTLDGFRLGAALHEGGMSSIFEAIHPDHTYPLLVKLPRLDVGDPSHIVSFEMEQMILPRLTGPHVPRFVAAAGFEAPQPFLAMERIPGPSLLPRLRELPLPLDEVAAIGAKVALALAAIHRQRVSHLDVKPANILFRPTPDGLRGDAVLVDFGLSHHGHLPDLIEEEFHLPHGTAPYMAPEQALGQRNEPRSDLFALGVLLYQFATGVLPFGEPLLLSHVRRRLWRDPVPPRRLRPDCPPWLQETILRCLEVEPERRHPTAAQLAFDLRNPEAVRLTPRATKLRRDNWLKVLERRVNRDRSPRHGRPAATAHASPIIAVAVDLREQTPPLAEALRSSVSNLLRTLPGARVACLNVLLSGALNSDAALDEAGRSARIQRQAELRHWAAPLKLEEGRITFHVLEGSNAADALLDYAVSNGVDHVVMGARAHSLLRSMLGSVSGEVAAKAPCSVTVVRTREQAA
ncbi:serine/threonine protein kinase [Roseomonas xinghualingensis]|uniref:serine/threonine protein kinase n=1 Tax=Roseomonas xinghualingensis TaxID=2986475 RepID=UPI0021F16DA6|nr:bifunctional serine/threonine-protein kinase/universal stress protein [Roseomonas sp. SXEYE001]MCV4209517.1 bifunctional serine/threonine-protein kinase/universal stress protein [Roseomonas sp. SXEYE001]